MKFGLNISKCLDVVNPLWGALCLSTGLTLDNIESIAAIVCSVIGSILLLAQLGLFIYNRVKDGKLTDQEIKEISDKVDETVDKLEDGKKGDK